jgi:hypothetical protein
MIPEFEYIEKLIRHRLEDYFSSGEDTDFPDIPNLDEWRLPLAEFVHKHKLTLHEASLLLIGLVPHVASDLFDKNIECKLKSGNNFPGIGGVRGKNSRSFLPTGETALFLLGGEDITARFLVQQLFSADHLFAEKKILWLEELPPGEPIMSGRIIMSQDYIDTFIYGKPTPPHFSMSFPAKKINEERDWSFLVINDELKRQIDEIIGWLHFNDELITNWRMGDRLKKGYRVLFHGPPGTGKTLTAGLLGKDLDKEVYKIDLSMIVSKYIGETEKNLELLFARAEDKGWILFFDEADALFGKRTSVRDAHDKYANQEVSYLLQRIEDYNGLIILATNMKSNIDDAFMRRFNAVLKFSFPDAAERAQIWAKSFPSKSVFVNDSLRTGSEINELVDIPEIVKKFELTGGSIINAVHYASLKAVERHNQVNGSHQNNHVTSKVHSLPDRRLMITISDVLEGIKKELTKDGKPFLG